MRARSAALICRMRGRQIRWRLLPVRQRGQRGGLGLGLGWHGSTPSRNVSLLRRTLGRLQPSRQDSLLELAHGPGQAFAGAAALADRRACAADPHAATADDPGRTGRRDRHLETGRGGERPAAGRSRTGGRHRQRTAGGRGRGRVGSYYALAGDVGVALAVSIAPEGIVAECVDAYGGTVSRAERSISRPPARTGSRGAAHRRRQAHRGAGQTPRLAVVSAAGPVDRGTGRLVQLPDEPFLLGELDPAEVLARTSPGRWSWTTT